MTHEELLGRQKEDRERLADLEVIKAAHWTRRPDHWKGTENTAKLNAEITRLKGTIAERDRWLKGKWFAGPEGVG